MSQDIRPIWKRLLGTAFKALGLLLLVVLAGILTLPYWMNGALKAVLPKDMVTFEGYQRRGYGWFELSGVSISTPSLVARIDSIVAPTPINWTYRGLVTGFEKDVVEIQSARVSLLSADDKSGSVSNGSPGNLLEAVDQLKTPLAIADRWLPRFRAQKLEIDFAGHIFDVTDVVWRDRRLQFQTTYRNRPESSLEVDLALDTEGLEFSFQAPNEDLTYRSRLNLSERFAILNSQMSFQQNEFFVEAHFGTESWLPIKAVWNADSWQIDAGKLGLANPYSEYKFDMEGSWNSETFQNEASGLARSTDGDSRWSLPDLEFESRIEGDLNQIEATSLNFQARGLKAAIAKPLSFDVESNRLQGEVDFDIDFDVSTLNWEDLQGLLRGRLSLSSDEDGEIVGFFQLQGNDIVFRDYQVPLVDIDAHLDWPLLEINSLELSLNGESSLSIDGDVDLDAISFSELGIQGVFEKEFLALLVPEGISIEQAWIEIEANGPWRETAHSGNVSFTQLENENLKPLSGNLAWKGSFLDFDGLALSASNDRASLTFEANGDFINEKAEFSIQSFSIDLDGTGLVSLDNAASIIATKSEKSTYFEIGDFHLLGPGGEVFLNAKSNYPQSVEAQLIVKNLDTGNWHDPWIKNPASTAEIRQASFDVAWNRGPILADGKVDAWIHYDGNTLFALGDVELDESGVRLDGFELRDASGPLAQFDGELPYVISAEDYDWIVPKKKGAISINLKSEESPTIARLLGEFLPYELASFSMSADIGGTLLDPEGVVVINLDTKEGVGENSQPPADIDLNASISGSRMELDEASISLLGESFSASGIVDFPDQALQYLMLEKPALDWKTTAFEVSIPESSLSPVAYFAPQLLRTGGLIESEFKGSLVSGLSGFISIENMNTRPIFPFGSLRDISTRFSLEGFEANLETFSGNIGLEPLQITGSIDFSDLEDLRFQMEVSGEDLPLLRSEGILLRSDLELAVLKNQDGPTSVTGELGLRESLFLLNLSSLTSGAGGGQTAASRPPYFAIDIPPLDNWKLDIALKGERFLILQTPAATGVLSIDKKLAGTLGEPFLQGRVEYNEGSLLFPFAAFSVEQGLVEIRSDDPYTPILSISGQSRRFGYDLGIEITGSAFDPQVRFTSSPPLTSEQILMMVMAGENPDGMFDYSVSQRASKVGTYLAKGLFSSRGSSSGLGSRFSLSSGQNLSRQGKETLDVEFKLDEQFQLLGEYDEYDAWNAGIRWKAIRRREFKGADDD